MTGHTHRSATHADERTGRSAYEWDLTDVQRFAVAALFFLRFWNRSRDRLFLMFSIAFWILAANRLALALLTQSDPSPNEHRVLLYAVRLAAFTLILIAIIDKKSREPRRRRPGSAGSKLTGLVVHVRPARIK